MALKTRYLLPAKAVQVSPTIRCDADPGSLTPPSGGTTSFSIKVQTTGATKKGNYEIKVEGKSGSLSKSTSVLIECVSCFPPKTISFSHSDKIVASIRNEEGYAGLLRNQDGTPRFCTSTVTWGCRLTTDLYGLYNDPIKPPGTPNCTFGFGHMWHKGPCTAIDIIAYKRLYPGDSTTSTRYYVARSKLTSGPRCD